MDINLPRFSPYAFLRIIIDLIDDPDNLTNYYIVKCS